MKIEVLGTGGAVSDLSTAYLLQNNILFDCGLDIVKKLLKENKLQNIEHVFISHLHMDHISGFELLVFYLQYVNKKINVYAGEDFMDFYKQLKCSKDTNFLYYQPFKFNCFEVHKRYKINNLNISTFPVKHMNNTIPAYGFKIKSYIEKVQILISGDTDNPINFISSSILEKLNMYCFHDMGLTGVELPAHLYRAHPTEEEVFKEIGSSDRIFGIHLSDSAKLVHYPKAEIKEYIFSGEPLC